MRSFFKILTLIVALGSTHPCWAAQNVIHLAGGAKFVCLDEITPARVVAAGEYLPLTTQGTRRALARLRSQRAQLRVELAEALRAGKANRANSLRSRIDTITETITGINACKNGELVNSCYVVQGDNEESDELVGRIVNGEECHQGNTFVVQIVVQTDTGTQYCSGFLASPWVVVTAAHCFYDTNNNPTASNVIVRATSRDYDVTVWDHASYIYEGQVLRENDYGWILLATKMEGVKTVDVIAPGEGVQVDEKVVFAGYGKDEEGFSGEFKAGYNIVTATAGGLIGLNYTGHPLMSNTCQGDSGGPLLVKRNGVWKVAGIVASGNSPDCSVGDFSVFTNLDQNYFLSPHSSYLLWEGPYN